MLKDEFYELYDNKNVSIYKQKKVTNKDTDVGEKFGNYKICPYNNEQLWSFSYLSWWKCWQLKEGLLDYDSHH